jgi:4-amino-4-deoxy-L-arabinose transferase-like glycosyltransferase
MGAVFLYRLALKLSGSDRAAMTSGVLFALHPLLIRQAAAASDLALVSTLLVLFAYAFVSIRHPGGAAIAGACLGLAVLTRSMVLPVLVCGLAILIWESRRAAAAAFVLAALLLVTPFALRNHSLSGSWLPTRSGINLYIGNSPYTDALLPDNDLDLLEEPAYALFARERPEISEAAPEYAAALDRFLTARALSYMMERPLRTLGRKLLNAGYCFSPRLVPYRIATADTRAVIGPGGEVAVENSASRPRVEVAAHAVVSTFILVTAVAGVYMRRRDLRHDAILWAVVATFVIVNALYVPASRYAAPMQFALLFYSGAALAHLGKVSTEGARVV